MRKILLLPLLLYAVLSSAQKIDGVGQLKIGKTYLQILQELNIESRKVRDERKDGAFNFQDVYKPKQPTLLRYNPDIENRDIDYQYLKCVTAFKLLIPEYIVAGIQMNDIEMSFQNDTLYQININSPSIEFTTAIETKYGKGSLKKTSKIVKCSSAYVKSYEEEEVTYTTTWENEEENIHISSVLESYRDSKCQEKYLSFFLITKIKTEKAVTVCERQTISSQEKKTGEQMKAKLKDF